MPGATPTLRQRSRVKLGGETFHIEALRGEGGFAKVRPIFELLIRSVISLKVGLILPLLFRCSVPHGKVETRSNAC